MGMNFQIQRFQGVAKINTENSSTGVSSFGSTSSLGQRGNPKSFQRIKSIFMENIKSHNGIRLLK